jgi:hypothetical protein
VHDIGYIYTMASALEIKHLISGGIITNYFCTSRCRHCLYGCSPRWSRQYIDERTLTKNISNIRSLGCYSVHIGGGEPFLNIDGLKNVIEVSTDSGIEIEYVETNSSWYTDSDSACTILSGLKDAGLRCVLVSMSPFHNEHIPFTKVKGVIQACNTIGISVYPWVMGFFQEMNSFDDSCVHSLDEYEARFGNDYLEDILSRYWVHMGGRAILTYKDVLPLKGTSRILTSENGPCRELFDTSHFHMDLFGNYIPGLCSGLAISCDDLGSPLSRESYPFLARLAESGISSLFDLATRTFGFKPGEYYLNKCHLCFDIRKFLVIEKGIKSKNLRPKEFYEHV